MATLEKEGVQFVNITINVPDQVGEAINQLPNRDSVDLHELKIIIEKYEQSLSEKTAPTKQKGKWAKLVAEIKEEKLLYGLSEEMNKNSREFRDNFAFKHDE